jgi:predicted AAA+ superfamily ATPase
MHGVVEEKTANVVRDGERRRATLEHHVVDRLGHAEVHPQDDVVVNLSQLGVE